MLMMNLVAFGQTDTSKSELIDQSVNWSSLIGEKYEVKYPENWDVDRRGLMGTSFILFSPVIGKNDQFRENVNLLIQDLTAYNLSLDQYVEISENQVKTMITNSNLILSERLKENGLEFHKVIYTGEQGVFNLKFEQYFWLIANEAYILTLTCEVDEFDNYQTLGETILKGFRIKKN